MFPADAVAFHSLLNGLIMDKKRKTAIFQIGEGRLILLGKGGGKVPGYHHVDIVVSRNGRCGPVKILRPERFVEIEPQENAYAETDRVYRPGGEPAADG